MSFTIAPTNGPDFHAGLSAQNKIHTEITSPPPVQPAANSRVIYTWYCDHNNGSWQYRVGQDWYDFRMPYQGIYTMQAKMEYYREGNRRPYAAFWSNRVRVNAM